MMAKTVEIVRAMRPLDEEVYRKEKIIGKCEAKMRYLERYNHSDSQETTQILTPDCIYDFLRYSSPQSGNLTQI